MKSMNKSILAILLSTTVFSITINTSYAADETLSVRDPSSMTLEEASQIQSQIILEKAKAELKKIKEEANPAPLPSPSLSTLPNSFSPAMTQAVKKEQSNLAISVRKVYGASQNLAAELTISNPDTQVSSVALVHAGDAVKGTPYTVSNITLNGIQVSYVKNKKQVTKDFLVEAAPLQSSINSAAMGGAGGAPQGMAPQGLPPMPQNMGMPSMPNMGASGAPM